MFSVPINGAIDIKEKIVKCVHQVHFITFGENTHLLVECIYSVNETRILYYKIQKNIKQKIGVFGRL